MADNNSSTPAAAATTTASPNNPAAPASGFDIGGAVGGEDPVLHHLKELKESNTQKDGLIERLQKEIKYKDDKVKELSADKRKEMEAFMREVVDTWLSSLSEVSDANKANFRQGITSMAEAADTRNPAWEIVCNASMHHQSNVKRIESLLQENTQKDKVIEELRGFKSEASRIGTAPNKRARLDSEAVGGPPQPAQHDGLVGEGGGFQSSAWDTFQSMLHSDSRAGYY